MSDLNLQQQKFCVEYIKDFNATQAYLRAGYKCTKESAASSAYEFLRIPEILKKIDELLFSGGLTKHLILKRLLDIADFDPGALFNEDESIKGIKDVPAEYRKCISSFKVTKRTEFDGRGMDREPVAEEVITEFKMWPKVKALEGLGRFFKLFTEITETKSSIEGKLHLILDEADEIAARYNEERKNLKEQQDSAGNTADHADSNV